MTSTSTAYSESAFSRFFYREETPYGLALMRITLCSVLAFVAIRHWPWTREIYSTDGATAPLALGYGYHYADFLPELSGTFATALMTALVFCLVAGAVGWCTRLSLGVACVLWAYFGMLDICTTMTKYTVIATHGLLLLSLSSCGRLWSIDRLLSRETETEASAPWPRRLLQLMVGVLYLGAAATKVQMPAFFSGDQMLHWAMTHYNFPNPVGEYLTLYPSSFVVMAYATLIWEVLFIFTCWRGWQRLLMLGIGVVFHVMTIFVLGLYIFPLVMLPFYLAFLDEAEGRKFATWCRGVITRLGIDEKLAQMRRGFPLSLSPMGSAAAFALTLGAGMAAGVEVEYQMDLYGERRPEGRYKLTEVPRDVAAAMLQQSAPLRLRDQFFSLDLGSDVVGNLLVTRRDRFQPGETLVAQCILLPPHADFWAQCVLLDSAGHQLDKQNAVLERSACRGTFQFPLNAALPTGEYTIELRTAGQAVASRRFTLGNTLPGPVAN